MQTFQYLCLSNIRNHVHLRPEKPTRGAIVTIKCIRPIHIIRSILCGIRSARMGRELCMSLTSVVLEAISTVEQDPLRFSSNNSQPAPQAPSPRQPQREQLEAEQPLSQSDSSEQSPLLDEVHETLEEGQEKGRTSSKRLSTRSILALAQAAQATQAARAAQAKQAAGGRARSGSECNILMPQRRAVRRTPMAGPRKFFKEDAGLRDLDAREEEFRKVRACCPCHFDGGAQRCSWERRGRRFGAAASLQTRSSPFEHVIESTTD